MAITLRVTTVGRKTGRPHMVRLYALANGERWVVVASYGGSPHNPDWYSNLASNPSVQVVKDGGPPVAMLARTAAGEERAELWPRLVNTFKLWETYQQLTEREIPVVILEPTEAIAAEPTKKRFMALGGAAIGSAMAGLDGVIFKTLPPPIEVVAQHRHDGPIASDDGTILTITMPNAVEAAEPAESMPTDE